MRRSFAKASHRAGLAGAGVLRLSRRDRHRRSAYPPDRRGLGRV